jgi:hypothetical protein
LDSAASPQVVLEELAACTDAETARAELDAALKQPGTVGRSWVLHVRFDRQDGHLVGEGKVVDGHGGTVAKRSLSTPGSECASVAKAIGVWASLVLDAEDDRRRATAAATPTSEDPLSGVPAARATDLWPLPPDKPPPEAATFLRHDKSERTVELGLASFVMGGTGGGAIVGASPFGVFETAHGFFLRPAFFIGHSAGNFSTGLDAPATFIGSRFDACARLPGMYREHSGIQLDLCLGTEFGFSRLDDGDVPASASSSNPTLPFVAVGPAIGMRGELGSNLSAIVRAVGELSLLRDGVALAEGGYLSPPLAAGRAEVGLSWSLR